MTDASQSACIGCCGLSANLCGHARAQHARTCVSHNFQSMGISSFAHLSVHALLQSLRVDVAHRFQSMAALHERMGRDSNGLVFLLGREPQKKVLSGSSCAYRIGHTFDSSKAFIRVTGGRQESMSLSSAASKSDKSVASENVELNNPGKLCTA